MLAHGQDTIGSGTHLAVEKLFSVGGGLVGEEKEGRLDVLLSALAIDVAIMMRI